MGFHCDYFGKDWEDDDPACDDCEKWLSCKRLTLQRKQKKKKKTKATVALANRIAFPYHTNPKYVLPAEGEPALRRIFFNIVAGMLSAFGGEIFTFFQEWKWPYAPLALPGKVGDEDDDDVEEVEEVEEVAKKSKVAKKIKVNDDENDEFDFDLDDL